MKKARKSKTIWANIIFLIVFAAGIGKGYVGDPDPRFVAQVETFAAVVMPVLNLVLRYFTKEAIK